MALADVPFYGAFLERKRQQEQEELADIKRAGGLQAIMEGARKVRDEKAVRDALATSGGNLEKALEATIRTGNIGAASKLSDVIDAQRKATAPRVMSPGSQLIGPNNQVLHTAPFAPERPQAQPEVVNLITMRDSLPEGHPARADLQGRIDRLTRGDAPGSFGGGTTGRSLAILTQHAPAYGAGALTPDLDREFEAALTHYTQPRQYADPDTGLMTTRRPELPPFVQEAVSRRRGARPSPTPGPTPQPSPAPAPQNRGGPLGGKTVWELSSLITGPVPAVGEMASRTPLVGDLVQAPQFTQARNYVPQLQRDLVRVLQNNPRYAEGERRAIEQDINIEGRILDNPTAYRDRLIGIDDALAVRERNAFNTANSARVGREERIQAMNVLNALRNFRENLGVPPRVRNDADWEALPPDTEYVAPDGRVKRKRAR